MVTMTVEGVSAVTASRLPSWNPPSQLHELHFSVAQRQQLFAQIRICNAFNDRASFEKQDLRTAFQEPLTTGVPPDATPSRKRKASAEEPPQETVPPPAVPPPLTSEEKRVASTLKARERRAKLKKEREVATVTAPKQLPVPHRQPAAPASCGPARSAPGQRVVALDGFLKPDARAAVTSGTVGGVDTAPRTERKGTLVGAWVSRFGEEEGVRRRACSEDVRKVSSAMVAHKARLLSPGAEGAVSTTTRVILLKQLDLVDLQRRLRSEALSDALVPPLVAVMGMDSKAARAKGIKHRRRQQMKQAEERQRRGRERRKEFLREVEGQRVGMEEAGKQKRERVRVHARCVREFHKRKERAEREKAERTQREKIALLKSNDVAGYLRLLKDTKSERVDQVLRQTESYLRKLGGKLQAMGADRPPPAHPPAGEGDGYLARNDAYYSLAHGVREQVEEQPAMLRGGTLREYQLAGLRWLLSLHNNGLNGILADEMGLGKTVQVIALLCFLVERGRDRGPFLILLPSSVLPNWERELRNWAPALKTVAYTGLPEERRRIFREQLKGLHFHVLLTSYDYAMNRADRPRLATLPWSYIIIDEGHRIKNAACKLNAELGKYRSAHRLLLTGTPIQNNLEELWTLLNFLLPAIFSSADEFGQWFNKPFEGLAEGDTEGALLSEEESLLLINRLHQVLRPFMLRRLKEKVEKELPQKVERLIPCHASAYQRLLMARVGGVGGGGGVHNTVMELRNICNHPFLSHLHSEEVERRLAPHPLPPLLRLCGKMEALDRILPKLKAGGHKVLFFCTMTRLLDLMEEYLEHKGWPYLRLDGATAGGDRGRLVDDFNRPDSEAFLFLLSIRAGGVGINLQAADTVVLYDTDWNPQVDLQAQARAHRIGQKRTVLVLRMETQGSVEGRVRAAAEYKLGVANQSITAGFFDDNTSAEDRREYLESLLREGGAGEREEAAGVPDAHLLNTLIARSPEELVLFEGMDGAEAGCEQPRLLGQSEVEPLAEALKEGEEEARRGRGGRSVEEEELGRGKRSREVRVFSGMSDREFERLCREEGGEGEGRKGKRATTPNPPPAPHQLSGEEADRNPAPKQLPVDG